jgi:release factor glutamine methyltransferase
MLTINESARKLNQELANLYPTPEAQSISWQVLEHVTGLPKTRLLAYQEQVLEDEQMAELNELLDRLLENEPLQYVLGKADFYGLTFQVTPAVLIPRPETEELVDYIVKAHSSQQNLRVLDLCTGSGCIAISLKKNLPEAEVLALDVSETALGVARVNADMNDAPVTFLQTDLLQTPADFLPLNLDIMVSNPPYVLEKEREQMRANVLQFEPKLALFVPDADPMLFYRRIADLGLKLLKPGGWLYFETNEQYAQQVAELMEKSGYTSTKAWNDFYGKPRFAAGQLPELTKP